MIRILDIIEDTMVDGPGFRTSIYCAGCDHRCKGCHNHQSWDFHGGREVSTEEVMSIIMADKYANVTFSGGDPMYQAKGFLELAKAIKSRTNKTIWCFTGFLFENLTSSYQKELLKYVDVIVDGPFIEEKRDTDLLFRGSSNQRVIDVQKSLRTGNIVMWKSDVKVA